MVVGGKGGRENLNARWIFMTFEFCSRRVSPAQLVGRLVVYFNSEGQSATSDLGQFFL